MNWEKPLKSMRDQLSFYIQQNKIKSLVLGVSGGIDSALVAAIVRPVCDDLKIKLIGRSLPNTTNKPDEVSRAERIGKNFCHDFDVHNINKEFQHIFDETPYNYSYQESEKFNKIAEGNIKARIRMIHLYDLAYRSRGMVLGTDNFSELMLGFWTLHGDVGDYGIIQNLWKTEVYDLSNWLCSTMTTSGGVYDSRGLALESCIKAVPTDGLGVSNSDLDQLGAATYDEVDRILKTWLVEDIDSFHWDGALFYTGRPADYEEFSKLREALKDHPVVQRHLKSMFKRNNPYNIPRNRVL
jgi:NAD+ synthetase